MTFDELPDLATVPEVAALFRLNRNKIYEAVRSGELPSVRVGSSIRIPKSGLAAQMDESAGPRPRLSVVASRARR